jgi:3-hydroxyacyl-CoA dehydrogenase
MFTYRTTVQIGKDGVEKNERKSVMVIGAGAIGTAMAAVFDAAGFAVSVVEPAESARQAGPALIARHRAAMELAGFEPGTGTEIAWLPALPDHITADLIIEAGPENLEIKQALFADLLERSDESTIIASTSSAIPISEVVNRTIHQVRCLVAHPGNPPSLIRVIELVPALATTPDTMQRAAGLLREAGFDPVLLGLEVPGFVFNRLQSAVLREAYRLVDEGVINVDGLDRLVRDGLGPRWALSGPFETAELNTAGGIRAHAERLGPAYAAIGEARGEKDCRWSEALISKVEAARRAQLPEKDLPARREWREKALAQLLAARHHILNETD